MQTLHKIFEPRAVAVVGASEEPGKVGSLALQNLLDGKFPGPIYPVNARRETVKGLPAYRHVAEMPKGVDLAVLCTPADTIPGLVGQCGEAGIGGLVILSAGFREVGAAGRALEKAIRDAARPFAAMRIIGPNCLGVIAPYAKLNASFAASMPKPGRVAFVSQSGALCTAILDWAQEQSLGFSHFVSVGNMLDVAMSDMLDYLAEDPLTEAVVLYIESIENARSFMSAARACARTKPIVAYKAGRFAASAQAAASHTGAMAGVDSVYEAAFERAGIVRVYDMRDLFDCAELLARGPRIRNDRLAIVTNAGGPGVMACDALLARKGTLAELSPATMSRLNELLPASWSHGNPVDVLGDATPQRFAGALEAVLADSGVDAVLTILTPQGMTEPTAAGRAVAEVANRAAKPVLASWMGAHSVHDGIRELNRAGIPTAPTPNDAVAAFMNLVQYTRNLEFLYETPREVPLGLQSDRRALKAPLVKLLDSRRDVLYEDEAKAFLSAYGIEVTQPRAAQSADEAVAIAQELGFPVVLKVVSPQITHKTDVGGVVLNVMDAQQARGAFAEIMSAVRAKRPDAEIEAITVQPMLAQAGGIELILGAKKDPVFGPVIMIGLGGIAAELFQDRSLGLPPLNERLARRMLESLRAWPLIKGYRGRGAIADADRLIEILLRFSCLVADFPEIKELDANPLFVHDQQVVALDARLIVDRAAVENRSSRPFSHLAIRPYPEDLVRTATLGDGTVVTLRPIKPEDEPLWRRLLGECSPESLRARFLGTVNLDSHEVATRFCFVDYDRELAVVAELHAPAGNRLIGVARVTSNPDSRRAEFAVLVGDAWQGKGLGKLFMSYCLENVDRGSVDAVYAHTVRENWRMVRVFERFGFILTSNPDPMLVTATKTMT